MPVMSIILEEPAWPDIDLSSPKTVWLRDDAKRIQVTALKGGMASGKPSVAIRLDLPDGTIVVAETSLVLFLAAADALKARFGDPRT